MRKLILGVVTAMTLTVTASAIDVAKLDDFTKVNCSALYAQGLFNFKAIFEKGSSTSNNLAQTQAGTMSLMMFNTCIMYQQNLALQEQLSAVIVELKEIKGAIKSDSDDIVDTPSTPSKGFGFDTEGDY